MEEDNGGHRSDTDVSAPMAPGVSSSPAILVSEAHQVPLPKPSSLDGGDKSDSDVFSSELPNEVVFPDRKPPEDLENGGILSADELEANDKVDGNCMDGQGMSTDKGETSTETLQENCNGAMVSENGSDVKDLGVELPEPLDDDQPLCMVFRRGKSGEDGLAALVGRKPTAERSSSPQDVLPASVSSPGIEKVRTYKTEFAEGGVKKFGHGEGLVVKSGTKKSRPQNGLERSSRKGSMEARRAPRHAKKRRYRSISF